MKVIHLPYTYHPDPVGGTEIYVQMLTRDLRDRQIDSVIAAPSTTNRHYIHENTSVWRYAEGPPAQDPADLVTLGDPVAAAHFADILDEEAPDILHMHAFTRAVSRLIIQEATNRGIPTVFTYHTPTITCGASTLLRWGKVACDGQLRVRRCTACMLQNQGVLKPISHALSILPAAVGHYLGRHNPQGDIWTALRMSALNQIRQRNVCDLFAEVQAIVVLCGWVKDLLLINDVDPAKLYVSPHGLRYSPISFEKSARPEGNAEVRLLYLGRLHPTKGVHHMIEVMHAMPDAPITLDIYGIPSGDYYAELHRLHLEDQRIRLCDPVPHDQIIPLIRQYDALIVPSRFFETGPLVVLEALAAGVPVVGSRLGGIAELIKDGKNGLLVDPYNIEEWTFALQQLIDPRIRARLRSGINPPRRSSDVASDMALLYQTVLETYNTTLDRIS